MKEAKQIKIMVVDNSGGYMALALRLAAEFKKTYYCNPAWQHSFPNPNLVTVGTGYEEIEVVDNIFEVFHEIDLWIFPDIYYGPLQEFLREQGEIVWGSGQAESWELYRDELKKMMQARGLPVNRWWKLQGLGALRKFLQKQSDVWVKVNKWRGLVESFYVPSYDLVKPQLDDIEYCKGIDPEQIEFIAEEPINDAIEQGYDGISIDGKFPEAWLSGIEVKDKAYLGQWRKYGDLSPLLTDFNAAMAGELKKAGYRGFYSLENRIRGKKSYMMDFTARMPEPPGSAYLALIKNLGEVIWAGANGELAAAEPIAEFAAQINLESQWCCNHLCPVYYPKEIAPFVKLKKARREGDIDFIVPVPNASSDIGAVVGIGKTAEEAIKKAREYALQVKSIDLSMKPEALDDAWKDLQEMQKI